MNNSKIRDYYNEPVPDEEFHCLAKNAKTIQHLQQELIQEFKSRKEKIEKENPAVKLAHWTAQAFGEALNFHLEAKFQRWDTTFLEEVFKPYLQMRIWLEEIRVLRSQCADWPSSKQIYPFAEIPQDSALDTAISFVERITGAADQAATETDILKDNGEFDLLPVKTIMPVQLNVQGREELKYAWGTKPDQRFSQWFNRTIINLKSVPVNNSESDRQKLRDLINQELEEIPKPTALIHVKDDLRKHQENLVLVNNDFTKTSESNTIETEKDWQDFLTEIAGQVSRLLNNQKNTERFQAKVQAVLDAYDRWDLAIRTGLKDAAKKKKLRNPSNSPGNGYIKIDFNNLYDDFFSDLWVKLPTSTIYVWIQEPLNPLDVYVPRELLQRVFARDNISLRKPTTEEESSRIKYFFLAVVHANKKVDDVPIMPELTHHHATILLWSCCTEISNIGNQFEIWTKYFKSIIESALDHVTNDLEQIPKPKDKKPDSRITKEEANLRARDILKSNPEITARELAAKIGCSTGLVSQLPPWKAVQAERKKRRKPKVPKAVSFTKKMENATGQEESTLDKLIKEQKEDNAKDKATHFVQRREP